MQKVFVHKCIIGIICLLFAFVCCPALAWADSTPVEEETIAVVTPDGEETPDDKTPDEETPADEQPPADEDPSAGDLPVLELPQLADKLTVWLYDPALGDSKKTEVTPVHLAFDGAYLPSDVPGMAVSGRTLVPVRLISEQLKAEVVWQKENNTVTIAMGGKTIILTIGSNTALINGEVVPVPDNVSVSLVNYEGVARTMVPVRFVSENLNALVDYDQTQRLVSITPQDIDPDDDEPVYVKPVGQDDYGNLYRRVVIDAGHGGSDPGTNGGGQIEKELTLTVSQQVRDLLEEKGYEVIMARDDDTYVGLVDRAALTTQYDAPLFVSIHCNAAENAPAASGIETYAAPDDAGDLELAGYLQKRLIAATSAKDRGVKTSRLVVLTHNVVPASLVEIGFMTNTEECAKLGDASYQQTLAAAITAGIEDYFAAH